MKIDKEIIANGDVFFVRMNLGDSGVFNSLIVRVRKAYFHPFAPTCLLLSYLMRNNFQEILKFAENDVNSLELDNEELWNEEDLSSFNMEVFLAYVENNKLIIVDSEKWNYSDILS